MYQVDSLFVAWMTENGPHFAGWPEFAAFLDYLGIRRMF
jgi:hypothetical protein